MTTFLCCHCKHNAPGGVKCLWLGSAKADARKQCAGKFFQHWNPWQNAVEKSQEGRAERG